MPVAYVATGEAFPDAMTASAAAAELGGPVLLVNKDSIPDSVKTELARLKPGRIVIQAGASSVSEKVATDLANYTTGTVTRNAGSDRYDTAVKAAKAFTKTGETVILATGGNYPDALSAASLYASYPGPLLLVEPGAGLSEAAKGELARLKPARVLILGGTGSVSAAAERDVKTAGFSAIRLGGADRYETSSIIANWAKGAGFGSDVIVASGQNFPDAIAAGALAKVKAAPVLLTNGSCWSTTVANLRDRLGESTLTILGGTGVQGAGIATGTRCS